MIAGLDPAEAAARLARHAMDEIRRELGDREASADTQASRVNMLLRGLTADANASVALPARVLQGIQERSPLGDPLPLPPLPATPLSQSDLLVNAEGQPNIGSELRAELATADSVDLICAFVIWSGVRHLRDALAAVIAARRASSCDHDDVHGRDREARGRRTRRLGADVRVAFDARTTKLHAKAWLLERELGAEHRVRRLVEPLAYGALRRSRVERAAVIDGRSARHRPRADDLRESLGLRALRGLRPGGQRR